MLSSRRLLEGRRTGRSGPILLRLLIFIAIIALAFATACSQEQNAPSTAMAEDASITESPSNALEV